jgi:hypothetical protein
MTMGIEENGIVFKTTIPQKHNIDETDGLYWLDAEELSAVLYKQFLGCAASDGCVFYDKKLTVTEHVKDKTVTYTAKKINLPHSGINAFILIPNNPSHQNGEMPEVKLIFTGTKDMPGFFRDMEPTAPGYESFHAHKDKILKALAEALKELPYNQLKLSLIGHSLGASDTQRLALYIVLLRMKDRKDAAFDKIKELFLVTNCSPKVTQNEADDFAEALSFARKNGLSFGSLACKYNLDFIPDFGECDIRTGSYINDEGERIDTFDLADKGIKLLYGKTYQPFLHESPIYDSNRKSGLHKIEADFYNKNDDANSQETKKKMKARFNRSTMVDKTMFSRLIKVSLTLMYVIVHSENSGLPIKIDSKNLVSAYANEAFFRPYEQVEQVAGDVLGIFISPLILGTLSLACFFSAVTAGLMMINQIVNEEEDLSNIGNHARVFLGLSLVFALMTVLSPLIALSSITSCMMATLESEQLEDHTPFNLFTHH